MKVNTDGVLLGAAMTIRPEDRCMLDIGTGTGTIALMAAQRVTDHAEREASCDDIMIDAIDIDEPSATEAAMNFANSPWSESLHAHNLSLDALPLWTRRMDFLRCRDMISYSPTLHTSRTL